MKHLTAIAGSLALLVAAQPALADNHAQPAAAPAQTAAKPAYSTAETTIGDLIDNPVTKAVLDKHLPGFSDNQQISMARAMTMRQIQGFAADMLPDEKLALVDADLAALLAQ